MDKPGDVDIDGAAANAAGLRAIQATLRFFDGSVFVKSQGDFLEIVPAYFCRLFHEKTGQHFSTFLTRTRMEKAQMMLSSKEPQTLGEISAACGYPNKSYFCQVFKKYTGMTPGEYQAMAKEK